MTWNPHVPKHRNRLKDPPDRTGKQRFIVQSVPITLLCCRTKQWNRMFACSSTKVGSTSKETGPVWCALPEPLPCESLAWKYLDTESWSPHCMWSQKCYCIIASWLWFLWDCRLGDQEGYILKGHLYYSGENRVSHPLHLWVWVSSIGNGCSKGKLRVILHVWMWLFFFLEEFSILNPFPSLL